jgi:hypothetical protein
MPLLNRMTDQGFITTSNTRHHAILNNNRKDLIMSGDFNIQYTYTNLELTRDTYGPGKHGYVLDSSMYFGNIATQKGQYTIQHPLSNEDPTEPPLTTSFATRI